MTTVTFTSSGTWTCPAGVTTVDAQCWAVGGTGGSALSGSHSGGGGGGGEYAEETTLAVTAGNVYTFTISGNTSFPGDAVTVTAHAGANASGESAGAGGTGSTNTIHFDGGAGGTGFTGSNKGAGGGGGAAGVGGAGGTGANAGGSTPGASGGSGTGGGGNGGGGGSDTTPGSSGTSPGGAGGGGGNHTNESGGSGAGGQITLTYTATVNQTATLAGVGTITASGGPLAAAALGGVGHITAQNAGAEYASLAGVGTLTATARTLAPATLAGAGSMTASGGPPVPAAVNQWSNSYGQGTVLGSTTPVLQSCVTPLNSTYAVAPGTTTSTAGNWLFAIVTWTQDPTLAEAHVNVADDVHSYWRQFPASSISGKTRTTIAYTPNIARSVGNVYVAPDNEITAMNVLVVEFSGLGPWDTLAGTGSNYAAAATSISLSQNAGGTTFFIGATGGDNTTATQAFLPAGWTGLVTQTQTDGTDHLCDNVLTAAFLPSSASNQSVTGTAGTAENLSGFILAVLVEGTSPIPAGHNPNWPYLIFEAAFGSGFNTPASELTWTDISSRLWRYDETTGIQYQLGSLQATNLTLELDNFDAALSPENASSPYYPNVTSGTPLRIRAALGTLGGITSNRWYVIQRNAQEWPEEIDESFRRFSPATGTDIWAATSAAGPTPYRGEVYADNPYAWWPCDDQPGSGGVLPTFLLNAAPGNTNNLNIHASPAGVGAGDAYTTTGVDATADGNIVPSVAIYETGTNSEWMYGDPESTPSQALAGNDITASPGSASWQVAGQLGSGGSNGWFLAVNDASFPPLSGGVTIRGWFNPAFFGSPAGWFYNVTGDDYNICGQPYSVITLMTLATSSAPVAILQLDLSGHLNFITYNGGTGTSHSIYTASDLRAGSFFSVDITMTTTTWTVYVNGGLTATVSGTATGMTSAWTWLICNGDLGSSGGSNLSAIQHGGNVAYSHITVFPVSLPLWRILAHYQAAITGFGLLPVPQGVSLTSVLGVFSGNPNYTPDGSLSGGSYGNSATVFSFSALATAQAGGYTSGPAARAVTAGVGTDASGHPEGNAVWVSWTALAPQVYLYTSASAENETNAATVTGSGDSFSSGYGAGASGAGVAQTAGGTGTAYPAAPSALGDTVAERIERVMGYGNVTYPGRCIDQAPLQVQAALDVGGQAASQNVQAIAISDGGMLFVDNVGAITYWQRPHLASQYSNPVWLIGPTTADGEIPYDRDIHWVLDPQRAWNAITISPYSPTGASLPLVTPSNGTGVVASQKAYGAQPYPINSYLQSQAEMQNQADFLFTNYGQPRRRAEKVKIDAASYPAAWSLVMGINVGDIVQMEDWQIGGGGNQYIYRVTEIKRSFGFGARNEKTEATVELTLDWEPPSYWT